jgi:hypothetical protein
MSQYECVLSIQVARPDTGFMMHTVPHIIRMCGASVGKKVLFRDDAPLRGEWRSRPSVGTPEQLNACCEELLARGFVDAIVPIDSSENYRFKQYSKHLDFPWLFRHAKRGTPVLAYIAGIEIEDADYIVHFDSDMLIHQAEGHSWIEEGIGVLRACPDVMAVLPMSGPPAPDGRNRQQDEIGEAYVWDEAGFFRYKTFTSRLFLIDRRRFAELLPLRTGLPLWAKVLDGLGLRPALPEWETMVAARLDATSFYRVDLASPHAWSLHPTIRGADFEAALPDLVHRVEKGEYPIAQGGYYDLLLDEWRRR